MSKYSTLIDLILSGSAVSREMADLLVAADSTPAATDVHGAAMFSRPLTDGELESLISEALDREAGL